MHIVLNFKLNNLKILNNSLFLPNIVALGFRTKAKQKHIKKIK